MKVLHIGLGAMHGGMESFMSGLIRHQRSNGIEADVVFSRDLGAGKEFTDICNVWYADDMMLEELLLNGRYDVLHIGTSDHHWAARRIKRARYNGVLVLTSHHCGAMENIFQSDYVVAVSGAVADSIRDYYGDKVRVIYNGIDTGVFYPASAKSNSKPIIAWIGRSNDAVKDISALVALARCPEVKDYQIIVVDASVEGQELGNWLPAECIVQVRKPFSQMPDFYREVAASNGFVLSTSRMEGCPMNLIEAQACGCPVIAPAVGGIPEVVKHETTGYLFAREGGVDAITDAINWLYSGDNYASASAQAIQHVEQNHTLERMCQEYTELYKEAIKKHHGDSRKEIFQIALRAALPAARLMRSIRQR